MPVKGTGDHSSTFSTGSQRHKNFSYSLVQTMKTQPDCEPLTLLVLRASLFSVWHLFGSFLLYAYFIKMHCRHIFFHLSGILGNKQVVN